jgi:hypothetical protein
MLLSYDYESVNECSINLGVIECLQNKQGSMARLQNILLSPSLSNNQNSLSNIAWAHVPRWLWCWKGNFYSTKQTNTQNQTKLPHKHTKLQSHLHTGPQPLSPLPNLLQMPWMPPLVAFRGSPGAPFALAFGSEAAPDITTLEASVT